MGRDGICDPSWHLVPVSSCLLMLYSFIFFLLSYHSLSSDLTIPILSPPLSSAYCYFHIHLPRSPRLSILSPSACLLRSRGRCLFVLFPFACLLPPLISRRRFLLLFLCLLPSACREGGERYVREICEM